MPRQKLTDKWLKNVSPPKQGQVDYFDVLLPGFGFRLSHGGAATFFVTTRIKCGDGKLVRLTVGRFPTLSLADARDQARMLLDNASRGIDPRRIRQSEIEDNQRKAEMTFEAVASDFLSKYAEKRLAASTIGFYRTALQKTASKWNAYPLASITRHDANKLLDNLDAKGNEVAADRTHAYLRKFFGWAVQKDYIQASPMDGLRRDNHAVSRERVLSSAELKWLWAATGDMNWPYGPFLKLLILTAQRRSEVAGMRWDELVLQGNDPGWLIPASRTKNKREQWVPLAGVCIDIIETLPRVLNKDQKAEFVFTTTGNTPISGFTKAKQDVDAGMQSYREKDGVSGSIPAWTFHDLRRTAATGMARLGCPIHVVEAVLNHKSGTISGVAAVYNRFDYGPEKRVALDKWANAVRDLNVYVPDSF